MINHFSWCEIRLLVICRQKKQNTTKPNQTESKQTGLSSTVAFVLVRAHFVCIKLSFFTIANKRLPILKTRFLNS